MTSDIRFGTDGWRAVIADDFTYANLCRVADAAGRVYAAEDPGGLVLVGYDTRFEAESFARAAAEVLASHGLRVRLSDRFLPTPALCWSVAHDEAAIGGIMLTASHNPAPYLGFKMRMSDGGQAPRASPTAWRPRSRPSHRRLSTTPPTSSRPSTWWLRTWMRCGPWWMPRPSPRPGFVWWWIRCTARARPTLPGPCADSA